MSISIKRAVLLDALSKCLPGISKGSSQVDGADTFTFDGKGSVRTYNDNISVKYTSVSLMGLLGAVKASECHQTISKLSDPDIEITVTDDKWVMKSGRAKPKLNRLSDDLVQYLECIDTDVSEWEPLPEGFQDALRLCMIQGNKVQRRGFFVTDKTMYSTDGNLLNRFEFQEPIKNIYLDDPAVADLLKLGKFTEINVGASWVHFRSEAEIVFSAKLKDPTDYPLEGISQYFAVADSTDPIVTAVLPKALAEAADRVGVFGNDSDGMQTIEVTITKDGILLESTRVSGGNEEDVPWDEPLAVTIVSPVSALVDPRFLILATDKAPNLHVLSPDDNTILVFSSDKFTQIASTRSKGA